MFGKLSQRERGFRVLLAALLFVIAYRLGIPDGGNTLNTVEAWGALALGAGALATGATGVCVLQRLGLGNDWAIGFLAGRLFVGWEFLHAGWDKLTGAGWVGSDAGQSVKGFLDFATSPAMTKGDFPAVPHWFADLTTNVFIPHAEVVSYLVVVGELAVGVGLLLGLFVRLSAFFGATMNLLFMLAGATGAGKNPEMLAIELLVLTGAAVAVYAASVDRYLLPRLTAAVRESIHMPGSHTHAPVH